MSDQCVQAMSHDLGCELCEGVEGEVCYVLRGGKVTAQQALTDALGKVKGQLVCVCVCQSYAAVGWSVNAVCVCVSAESCLSLSSDGSARAVFAVPTNFSACQKNAVRCDECHVTFTCCVVEVM